MEELNGTNTAVVENSNEDSGSGSAEIETNPQPAQPSRFESYFAITKSLIVRALIIYFISSFFTRPNPVKEVTSKVSGSGAVQNVQKIPAWNLFENGTIFDLHIYVSEDFDYINYNDPKSLIWFQYGLVYGDWYGGASGDGTFTQHLSITPSQKLQSNGSIFIHVFVTKSGTSPNPTSRKFAKTEMGRTTRLLNKFKKVRYTHTHNLLTGETEKSAEEVRKSKTMKNEVLSHWHPNLTINLVTDQTNWVKGTVPAPLDRYVEFDSSGRIYYPILYINDYWNMLRDYKPINNTVKELQLTLIFQPLSLFKWQLYAAQAIKNEWTSNIFGETLSAGADESDEEQDSIKETLLETNPYLLGVTIVISIFHSVFEFLAFKNDIQFWNNRKSLEGLSVRSVFFGVFQSVIVLLYVLDNETNFMIRISCLIGLGIEVWKIQKVVDFHIHTNDRIFNIIPKISFSDKGSYAESSTREYDKLAFKYLGWMCFPLLIGYSIYSIIYNEHKGWYSFVLNMLYGYLLTFGFIMMTPQLFINYKLKSVAHLPWRMMTYKFLNTFIDDIFAFVIKMPTMYRIGCFRDDIVFFIFLYQRWQYRVDHKRINEFGFSGEMNLDEQKQLATVDLNTNTSSAPSKSNSDKKDD